MMSSPSHGAQTSHQPRVTFSKEILVRGDVTEDVTDIVEKFIKVAHGPEALENNRARENARENIRKKLAMEAGREKQDSCDLQVNTKLLWQHLTINFQNANITCAKCNIVSHKDHHQILHLQAHKV